MYYFWDLYNQTYQTFRTKLDLVLYWKHLFGEPYFNKPDYMKSYFEQLNMTGNDMFRQIEYTGKLIFISEKMGYINEVTHTYYTRRYEILDEYGRHIDIRLFDKSLWLMERPRRKWTPWFCGARKHHHRATAPANTRQNMRSAIEDPLADIDELYPDLNKPIKNTTALRNKASLSIIDVDDYYDRKHAHGYYASHCWKDQTRTRKQYDRHNPNATRKAPKSASINPDWLTTAPEDDKSYD